jgi:homocysteine S-methyltransferase
MMSNPISHILDSYPLVVLDGAMGTELASRGADLNDPLWSARLLIEQPELIRAVHADYYAAGADVATTASYQATFEGFARRGFSPEKTADLMSLSVSLATEARDAFWADETTRQNRPRPLVAASVGPYGAYLADGSEYRGDYGLSIADLMDFHRPRMAVLAASGADILACETIPCLDEARAIVRLLDEFPDVWAWVSFSARDDESTNYGESIADCAAEIGAYGRVASVGVNCTAPEHIASLVGKMHTATDKPILTYPNSGESYDSSTKTWSGHESCDAFVSDARVWYAAGARLIGGCCRTTPAHIRALAGELRA